MSKLTYPEEIVSEYHKHILDKNGHPKYFVLERVPFQAPGETAWHDIDVLAVSRDKKQLLIIETKTYVSSTKNEIPKIISNLRKAEKYVKNTYGSVYSIDTILVAEDISKGARRALEKEGIRVTDLRGILSDYLDLIYKKWNVSRARNSWAIGKEENNLTRMLYSLVMLFEEELENGGIVKNS